MSTYNHLFSSSQQLYPNRCRKCVHCLADLSAQVNVFQVNSLSAVQNKTFKKGFHEINCGVHQKITCHYIKSSLFWFNMA